MPDNDRDNLADGSEVTVDVSDYHDVHSTGNRILRMVWGLVWAIFFRPSPRVCHGWRRLLLQMFGAKLGKKAKVYPSCRVWAPWHLRMGDYSCLGPNVDCSCVAPITIGKHSTVSQYTYLCAASHDYRQSSMPLTFAPIKIADQCWICADVFIGPGVTVGTGAVVGAKSCVMKDVDPWAVVAGNPAKFVKRRIMRSGPADE